MSRLRTLVIVTIAIIAPCMTVPSMAAVTPGALLNFDASTDVGGNNIWASDTAEQDGNWTFSNGAQSPVAVADPNAPGITAAYNFPAGVADTGTYQGAPLNNADTKDATFELWVNTSDLVGKHVLFETGGNGQGAAIELNGRDVVFTGQQDPSTRAIAAGQFGTNPAGEFRQIVGTIDFTGGSGRVDLYLDGNHVASDTVAGWSDFAGGDASGLGQVSGNGVGSVAGIDTGLQADRIQNFDGQIGIFRFYSDVALTPQQVKDNYNAVSGTPRQGPMATFSFDDLRFNWDAAAPGDNPTTNWRTNHNPEGTDELNWSSLTNVSVGDVSSQNTKIHRAYSFDGTGGAQANTNIDALTPNPSQSDATWEIWVRPNTLTGNQTLLDLGGNGSGTSLILTDNVLRLQAQTDSDSNEANVTAVLGDDTVNDFQQIAFTIDFDTGMIQLYLNGEFVGSDTNASLGDWAGSNPLGLGSRAGNAAIDDDFLAGTFDGDIAILRYYTSVLDGDTIRANFDALQLQLPVPEPASFALLAVGGLAMMRRRRA